MAELTDVEKQHTVDARLGFVHYQEGPEKLGWLVNMHATSVVNHEKNITYAAVDLYFLEDDGGYFKCTLMYEPYFYLACKPGTEDDIEDYLRRRFERQVHNVVKTKKQDLHKPNHLSEPPQTFLQIKFLNVQDLLTVRKTLDQYVRRNKECAQVVNTYTDFLDGPTGQKKTTKTSDPTECMMDIREYDVTYYVRVAIDMNIRVGLWYEVKALPAGQMQIKHRADLVKRAEPVVLAFDIETTKLPLKFPDATIDMIMMISYMIDGQGYLITNREVVSQDIGDFEYTPKPEFEGPFIIFNERNERALLRRFLEHFQEAKPTVVATYNGDMFDWPFVEARARVHGINLFQEIGFYKDSQDEYKSKTAIHMDCFRWVKRDSYLPAGSHGLKAVTTAKLGYNPMELDPEDMTPFAAEKPQTLAQYSVSDAVATYYLYMKYVHPFVFSLCTIIPMVGDDVLRKGSGTLCEMLLMVEAYQANIIMPNKHIDPLGKIYNGHLIESETYVGGHVEALEAGVFRSDLPERFNLVPAAVQQLIDQVDAALQFSITVEAHQKLDDVTNYDQVKDDIISQLKVLRDSPNRTDTPLIYHLDVAAMYPNIILTNRLQPDSIIDESTCARCNYNVPGKTCDRRLTWAWRGEYFPAKRNEYNMIRAQLESEKFPSRNPREGIKRYGDLPATEQAQLLQKRLGEYCRKVYRKVRNSTVVPRESIVCQRENSFYVDTVRSFRDRRYEYKGLHKVWKKKADDAMESGNAGAIDEAKKMVVLYDSLQLAHKCILNSFYGYVMRKGSRWYSMEMAGIVCLTGATLIQMARQLIEQLGRPLELDTDGIWCILPSSFPETFYFTLRNGKKLPISYPCVMLNHLVHAKFTNHQYHDLVDPASKTYKVRNENSIFFEVDGPYRAMILPASTAADKLLKKRYAVFNFDGSLAELKGFEVKRRGELKLIKIFQSQIFHVFLDGSTLAECYGAVARLADQWLDVLYSRGQSLQDLELFELISENRNMSKSLAEYGSQKSTSISTARRLAEFLGDQVVKDKGLSCQFIISHRPLGLPVSERAIPITIFSAEPSVKKHFLRKWLKDPGLQNFDIRGIIDWEYYLERFGSVIQKLITIPAAMQKVANPVPRVKHPDWLAKRVAQLNDKSKQSRISDLFSKVTKSGGPDPQQASLSSSGNTGLNKTGSTLDLEDLADSVVISTQSRLGTGLGKVVTRKRSRCGMLKSTTTEPLPPLDLRGLPDPETVPAPEVDYPTWLAYQKLKWKRQRQRRLQVRTSKTLAAGEVVSLPMSHPICSGLGSYFSTKRQILTQAPWQVVQARPTDTPGVLKLWVMVNQALYSVTVEVPRVFYVNSRVPNPVAADSAYVMEVSTMTLPRSQPCHHLYRFVMPEQVYQEHTKSFRTLFSHPDITGVYETQIDPVYRFLLTVGCTTMVTPNVQSLSEAAGECRFQLDELLPSTDVTRTAHHQYLHSSRVSLNFVYLFHSATDTRQIFGLFSPSTATAQVFVTDGLRGHLQLPNLETLYQERLAKDPAPPTSDTMLREINQDTSTEGYAFAYPAQLVFQTTIYKAEGQLQKALQVALNQLNGKGGSSTMVVLHSVWTPQQLLSWLPGLHDTPYLCMPFHRSDRTLPALNWQRYASRRMLNHFFNVSQWVHERVAQARYADTPVGNIEQNPALFLSDLFLARRLLSQNVVLWWSPSRKPDLGGREEDEHQWLTDEVVNTEINHPGMYPKVCVEIDVGNLAINTILQAQLIHELEGASSLFTATEFSQGSQSGNKNSLGQLMGDTTLSESGAPATNLSEGHPSIAGATWGTPNSSGDAPSSGAGTVVPLQALGDAGISQHVFNVLRTMVRKWYTEIAQYHYRRPGNDLTETALSNSLLTSVVGGLAQSAKATPKPTKDTATVGFYYAEIMTQNFYHWLTHPGSKLYDPCLYALVQGLMRKVFLQLLAEMRRLGAQIVFANFQKIIVATTKTSRSSAAAYTQYLLKTLTQMPLFDQLDLQPVEVWDRLLWMDSANFGGVLSVPGGPSSDDLHNITNIPTEPSQKIEMSWNIREYLPPAIQDTFELFLTEFLYELHNYHRNEGSAREGNVTINSAPDPSEDNVDDNAYLTVNDVSDRPPKEDPCHARKLIIQQFMRKMLRLLPDIQHRCATVLSSELGDIDLDEDGQSSVALPSTATQFPILPGSYLNLTNPALEFVKNICAVLDLIDGVQHQVRVFKRNILGLLDVREFSHEATFLNPSQSLKLMQVICEYCNYCRDLDFCRDLDLLPVAVSTARDNTATSSPPEIQYQTRPWLCVGCHHEYDRAGIELALVDLLLRRLQAYQLQDLKCKRCRMVKAENLLSHCPTCSASFTVAQLSSQDFLKQLQIFHNIAAFHKLDLLADTVEWVVSHQVKA
ncbi:DNA polymerase epsilon catalytic subunit [Dispira simplex]|nr:DNA polymerase epsilon catalytic subunit [Dispira simplex]